MFKKSYVTSMLLIAMLLLAACGTSPEENSTPATNPDSQDPIEENEDSDKEIGVEEEDQDETENDKGEANEDEEAAPEENDANEDNDSQHNDLTNTEQVDSEAQDFSMSIFPEYTLTSEEPGRDSLFPTDNDDTFMRIETMPFDEETYAYFEENTISLLESIKADGAEVTDATSLPQGDHLTNAIGYTVNTDDGIVTGFVFEKDGLLIRLTLFDTADETQFTNFLTMGETIISN